MSINLQFELLRIFYIARRSNYTGRSFPLVIKSSKISAMLLSGMRAKMLAMCCNVDRKKTYVFVSFAEKPKRCESCDKPLL